MPKIGQGTVLLEKAAEAGSDEAKQILAGFVALCTPKTKTDVQLECRSRMKPTWWGAMSKAQQQDWNERNQ